MFNWIEHRVRPNPSVEYLKSPTSNQALEVGFERAQGLSLGPLFAVRMAALRLIRQCGVGILIEGITRAGACARRKRSQTLLQGCEPTASHSRRVGEAILTGKSCRRDRKESERTNCGRHCDQLEERFHFCFFRILTSMRLRAFSIHTD